ncbi:AI-2E family transporter [Polynucleobacter sp. HIN5]|uniref:AI-2E family transporter n=1 Tax=Polynucleobacter sp. HIN5 TaxID=3047864 RepID=UPI0025733F09|nr:AI-2E family transporter [Polynucleobacter sp. HIN5]BEI34151.1 AI-2E family transporter [Polynucleobacter sp. HIN5]
MAEIFTPFLFAFILAYILRPLVLRLQNLGLGKTFASSIGMLFGLGVFLIILLLLINLLRYEIPLIKAQLPIWLQSLQTWLGPKLLSLNIEIDWLALRDAITQKLTAHFSANANQILSTSFETILASGSSVLGGLVNIVLILFVLFYLLIDWQHFFELLKQLLPIRYQDTALRLALETDLLLSQYLRGQMLVILIMAVFYSAGLSLTGMHGALGLGVFTALVIVIPYIGIALGLILAVLSVVLQFGLGPELVIVLVVFGIGQVLEGFFLTPRLVGERIGLHPVAVLFALLIFAKLFGFFGVLLALPASAVVLVLIRFAWSQYAQSSWYQK